MFYIYIILYDCYISKIVKEILLIFQYFSLILSFDPVLISMYKKF